jgi:hypothetical protein
MSKNTDLGSLVNYIKGQVTGRLNAPAYTSATAFTGTIAGFLGFDTSGNILTSAGVGLSGSGTTNYHAKFTGSTALGNSLIFDNGTNIGINTASPNCQFHIVANSTDIFTSGLKITRNEVSGQFLTLNYEGGIVNFTAVDTAYSGPAFRFNTSTNGSTITERVRIQASGNVGIGNTNNTYKLDVTGDVNISGSFRINGTAIATGVTGSGTTNLMPLWTSTTGLGNSIIYNNAGNLGINSTTDGYTLNAIRSASTQFNDQYKGAGTTVQIFSRFMQDESVKKGIAIGYNASANVSGIWATQDSGALRLGIWASTTFKTMMTISATTISMDLPTSGAGLISGQLWNSGGAVQIIP